MESKYELSGKSYVEVRQSQYGANKFYVKVGRTLPPRDGKAQLERWLNLSEYAWKSFDASIPQIQDAIGSGTDYAKPISPQHNVTVSKFKDQHYVGFHTMDSDDKRIRGKTINLNRDEWNKLVTEAPLIRGALGPVDGGGDGQATVQSPVGPNTTATPVNGPVQDVDGPIGVGNVPGGSKRKTRRGGVKARNVKNLKLDIPVVGENIPVVGENISVVGDYLFSFDEDKDSEGKMTQYRWKGLLNRKGEQDVESLECAYWFFSEEACRCDFMDHYVSPDTDYSIEIETRTVPRPTNESVMRIVYLYLLECDIQEWSRKECEGCHIAGLSQWDHVDGCLQDWETKVDIRTSVVMLGMNSGRLVEATKTILNIIHPVCEWSGVPMAEIFINCQREVKIMDELKRAKYITDDYRKLFFAKLQD
jgi:hypothetical protein